MPLLPSSGGVVIALDDAHSNRIRCDHPDVPDGQELGRLLLDQAAALGRDRVVALTSPAVARGLVNAGYEEEAVIPGFYRGRQDCHVLGAWPGGSPDLADPSAEAQTRQVIEGLDARPVPELPDEPTTTRATEDDADAIARLLRATFRSYPTPSDDPAYIREQLRQGTPFRLVTEDGEVLACASADLVRRARTAELTDCATAPANRGRGYMQRLLLDLMLDLRELKYPTAFTLARSAEPGMNVAFKRLGFDWHGTMKGSCRIGEGIEDMNVWSRALPINAGSRSARSGRATAAHRTATPWR